MRFISCAGYTLALSCIAPVLHKFSFSSIFGPDEDRFASDVFYLNNCKKWITQDFAGRQARFEKARQKNTPNF